MSSPVAPSLSSETRPSKGEGLSLWEYVSFTIVHTLVAGLLSVLSLGGLYRLGRLFGTLEWLVNYRRRRRFGAALRNVLGHKPMAAQRRRATREFFMRHRCDRLFYLIFDCLPRDKALALFSIENKDLLDSALARGRGVYLAMSHHGPYHVAGMFLAMHGYKVAAVRDRREGGIRRYIQGRFDRLYPEFQRMRVIFEDSFPREIYRCFHEGFVLGSAMDVRRVRRAGQKAEEVTIFGEKRQFLTGPLHIALRCRTPVVQAFILPERGFHYRLQIVGMLADPEDVKDEAAAVGEAVRTYAANVERFVRASPSLLSRL